MRSIEKLKKAQNSFDPVDQKFLEGTKKPIKSIKDDRKISIMA